MALRAPSSFDAAVLEKLAVGAGQYGVQHLFRSELTRREIADGLKAAKPRHSCR